MKDSEKVLLTLEPRSLKGNLAPVDGVPEWTITDPAVATVVPAADGLTAYAVAQGAGTCEASASADGDMTEGVRLILAPPVTITVTVEAETLTIVAGVPEPQ